MKGLLNRLPPAGREHLVQVQADADVRVGAHPLQRTVSSHVKTPGLDALLIDRNAPLPKQGDAVVLRARVQHDHFVRFRRCLCPAARKLLLVFADGIDCDFHPHSSFGWKAALGPVPGGGAMGQTGRQPTRTTVMLFVYCAPPWPLRGVSVSVPVERFLSTTLAFSASATAVEPVVVL